MGRLICVRNVPHDLRGRRFERSSSVCFFFLKLCSHDDVTSVKTQICSLLLIHSYLSDKDTQEFYKCFHGQTSVSQQTDPETENPSFTKISF